MLANYGFRVSPRTYNRYEDGTRKFPKEIYNLVLDYLQQDSLSADDVSKFIKNEKERLYLAAVKIFHHGSYCWNHRRCN